MSDTPPTVDADPRAVLGTLIERWQQQLARYEERAEATPCDRYAQYARIRATRVRSCIHELQIVLNTGHIPYDLMTDEELAALSVTRDDADIVEAEEMEASR